tara:strand:- start:927 stop:1271 length:345 start_codon:yes stop_codon:yes gene_type:complete
MEEKKDNAADTAVEQPIVDTKVGKQKIKRRKILKKEEPIIKVDLSKKPETKENEVTDDNVDKAGVTEDVKSEDTGTTQEQKEVQPEEQTQEEPVLEEITDEKVEEKVEELVERN